MTVVATRASAHRLLAEEDKAQLNVLDPRELQVWCDSGYISRIYAFRSIENDEIPIH